MLIKTILMSVLIAGGASVALAQEAAPAPAPAPVPTCSKTVTDKCINRTATKRVVVHHRTKVVKKTTVTKPAG